jgi:hypothetical protein
MIALASLVCSSAMQRLVVVNIGILFTYTQAWLTHIYTGQLYLIVAMGISVIMYLLIKFRRSYLLAVASVVAVVLIFVRASSLFIFTPLFFSFRANKRFLTYFLIVSIGFTSFFYLNQYQRQLWIDYKNAMVEQLKLHQDVGATKQINDKPPYMETFEGFNYVQLAHFKSNFSFKSSSEHGNFFVIYRAFTGRYIPIASLQALWILSLMLLSVLFLLISRRQGFELKKSLLFGLILYMTTEFFSPIHRGQYNAIQWLPIILLSVSMYRNFFQLSFILILGGMALNITNTKVIPFRHTVGECLFFAGILLLLINNKTKHIDAEDSDNNRSRPRGTYGGLRTAH